MDGRPRPAAKGGRGGAMDGGGQALLLSRLTLPVIHSPQPLSRLKKKKQLKAARAHARVLRLAKSHVSG